MPLLEKIGESQKIVGNIFKKWKKFVGGYQNGPLQIFHDMFRKHFPDPHSRHHATTHTYTCNCNLFLSCHAATNPSQISNEVIYHCRIINTQNIFITILHNNCSIPKYGN